MRHLLELGRNRIFGVGIDPKRQSTLLGEPSIGCDRIGTESHFMYRRQSVRCDKATAAHDGRFQFGARRLRQDPIDQIHGIVDEHSGGFAVFIAKDTAPVTSAVLRVIPACCIATLLAQPACPSMRRSQTG